MTFTYRLDSADLNEANIAKIRLEIGDNDEERGIKPDASNFTDEEILYIFGEEDENVGRAAARICEQMATSWSSVPRTMFGSLFDPRAVVRNYMKQAENLRAIYGHTDDAAAGSFSVGMKRS